MKKEIIFLVASCTFAIVAACGDDTTPAGPTDSGMDAKEGGGSSSSGGKSSSTSSSSGGGMDSGSCANGMTPVMPGICCVPSLMIACPTGQICCGSMGGGGNGTDCQPNTMMCAAGKNQLCAKDSDCLASGTVCGSIMIGGFPIGVCLPGDGGAKEGGEGGSSGGGDAGDAGDSGGSSSGGEGGGDTGSSDAPSEGG